tara:strand:- start:2508 stop:2786 length:279 start_codon:yes stop_codon:yes gene_type:complete
MSIAFKPKIPDKFDLPDKIKKKANKRVEWSKADIKRLVHLRAMHIPYRDCEIMLNRTRGSCAMLIHTTGALVEVNQLRKQLIDNIMAVELNE